MITILFSLLTTAQANSVFFKDIENFKNQSLSLQTEKQNLEATSDTLLARKLFWTPTVSVSAIRSKTELTNTPTVDTNYLQADVGLNLFRGGADIDSLQAASAANKAQALQVLNESLGVEIRASDLIFKSIYLAESRRIQEGSLRLKEESLRIVSDRYQQGKLPAQDVTKAEVDLTQQKNKARLTLLDLLENKSQMTSAFVSEIETKSWPFSEATNLNLGTQTNFPLIEQKYWLSQSRDELWQASKGGHWPTLDLTLQAQQAPINERSTKQLIGLVQLTLPLWSRYETSAQISSAYAQKIAALNDFRSTEQTLKQKSIFLKNKIEVARQNLAEAKTNLEKSKRLYQDILRSFRLGRLSTNDLFLEQTRLLESENALTLSQLSFHQTVIESCALAGIKASDCVR